MGSVCARSIGNKNVVNCSACTTRSQHSELARECSEFSNRMMLRRSSCLIIKSKPRFHIGAQWFRGFYDSRTKNETIYAPATSVQSSKGSPLAIIRLSGNMTVVAVRAITRMDLTRDDESSKENNQTDQKIHKFITPRRATLAKICDPNQGELIDVGLVLWFPKPNSYTGEDLCELHLHGSQAIVKRVLSILGDMDSIRPAEPGEFTRRAVQNSKMSLIQAESLSELIGSQTDVQRRLALKGLTGSTRKKYDRWKDELVHILAHLEASIDFGEDELLGEQQVVNDCVNRLKIIYQEISVFKTISSRCRDLTRRGARVCIVGRPNVGKSSFMNLLCRQEKSIVSELSGTTRDVIEHSFELGGHNLILSDTAGLKNLDSLYEQKVDRDDEMTSLMKQHESVERDGIRRAALAARKSDLILYVIDGSRVYEPTKIVEELEQFSKDILEEASSPQESTASFLHVIVNKIDLNQSMNANSESKSRELEKAISDAQLVWPARSVQVSLISCKTKSNFGGLIDKIKLDLKNLLCKEENNSGTYVGGSEGTLQLEYVNERHLAHLSSVALHLAKACELDIRTVDEMAQHVRESVDYLSRIVGTVSNEQVLDIVFKDFCIGK